MKKTTLVSIITDAVAILLLAAMFLTSAIKGENLLEFKFTLSITTMVAAGVSILVKAIFDKKNPILIILPVALVTAVLLVNNQWIDQNIGGATINLAVLFNSEVLSLLLLVVFAVSVILYLLKGYKWAGLINLAYAAVLLIYTIVCFVNMASGSNNDIIYILEALAYVVLNASLVIYFLASLIANNELAKKEKSPKAPKEKKEKAAPEAEAVAENSEETAEDTPAEAQEANEEAPAEEEVADHSDDIVEVKDDSNQSIFDVQDEAEKKEFTPEED